MIINIKNLSYNSKKGTPILNNINLEIEKGTHHFIIGKTGSGKSTLIQMLNGLKKGKFQKFEVNNLSIEKKNLKEIRSSIGMVIQFPENQIFESTIEREIAFGIKERKDKKEEIETSVIELMKLLNLDLEKKDDSPLSLSGGEMRKVALASIFILDSDIIVLDEPSCGLDPKTKKDVLNALDILKGKGKTIVHITHDMELVYDYGDMVTLLKDGKDLLTLPPLEFFQKIGSFEDTGIKPPLSFEIGRRLGIEGKKSWEIVDYFREAFYDKN